MMLLRATALAPIIMVVLALVAVAIARLAHMPKPRVGYLVSSSLAFAAIGGMGALLIATAWIVWSSTLGSPGNGPPGGLFLYGPLGVSLGQLYALIAWWFKKRA